MADTQPQSTNDSPIDHYVVLLSEHNVAEFKAILQFKPRHIHVVVTDFIAKKPEEGLSIKERFERTLLPYQGTHYTTLNFLDKQPLEGERMGEVSRWIAQVFTPYANTNFLPKQKVILNNTGATKPLSFLLTQAYPWTAIDYKAFRQKADAEYIDRCYLANHRLVIGEEILSDQDMKLTIRDYLNLYVDELKSGVNTANITANPDSLTIAQLRFDAQRFDEHTVINGNFFAVITPVLNELWYGNPTKKYKQWLLHSSNPNRYCCQWAIFGNDDIKGLKAFFARIYALDKALLTYAITDNYVEIPVKKDENPAQHWLKWLSGGWFEQLIYQWLKDFGFEDGIEITTGLIPEIGKASANETDILMLSQGRLTVLELKCDIPYKKSPDDFRKQLNEHQDLGKFGKGLILSSIIKTNRGLDENQKNYFIDRCKDKKISIFWVENKQQFKQSLIDAKLLSA